jgi:hypothetical protein
MQEKDARVLEILGENTTAYVGVYSATVSLVDCTYLNFLHLVNCTHLFLHV